MPEAKLTKDVACIESFEVRMLSCHQYVATYLCAK